MTDYTSQGKTRPKNPVDLSNCRSHQSYYTCLSRSATASGTVIVQSFSPRLITCGASGYLRQEFRELELLDEITKLRYEGKLPDHIQGKFRNLLIRAYQTWKGTNYIPGVRPLTPYVIRHTSRTHMPRRSSMTYDVWRIRHGGSSFCCAFDACVNERPWFSACVPMHQTRAPSLNSLRDVCVIRHMSLSSLRDVCVIRHT